VGKLRQPGKKKPGFRHNYQKYCKNAEKRQKICNFQSTKSNNTIALMKEGEHYDRIAG